MKENNNYWVYYNGELYHAGVKGMQWGKHLPGTDWWKKTVQQYNQDNAKRTTTGFLQYRTEHPNQAKAHAYAAKEAIKLYGGYIKNNAKVIGKYTKEKVSEKFNSLKTGTSKFWNAAKDYSQEQINKYRESARQAYKTVRKQVYNVMESYYSSSNNHYMEKGIISSKGDGINHLKDFVDSAPGKAVTAYKNAKLDGPFSAALNSFIQTTKFNIATGCARWLDSIGMDDEVASFLRKFKR